MLAAPLRPAALGSHLVAAASSRLVYVIAALTILLLLGGAALLYYWLRIRAKAAGSAQNAARSISLTRLRDIWDSFLSRLPSTVRATLPSYPHFVVFGNSGSGKSALIARNVDWQGQTSQFLPSYTADPLMQVYLGSRTIAQEFSSVVQDSAAGSINAALKRLWRHIDVDEAPTVVIVLLAPSLASATPDQIRQQAQLLRGKINILSESCGSSVRVRLCLTHMDSIAGFVDLARFLSKEKLTFELDIGTDAGSDLSNGLAAYERLLPQALTTQPLTAFENIVEFLRTAEKVLGPLASFISALSEGSVVSQRPEIQRAYFSTLLSDAQVGNPFDPPPRQRGLVLGSLLSRWLRPLGIRPLHALLGLLILAIGLTGLSVVTRRHRVYVTEAELASGAFEQAVERALATHTSAESDVVRRTEQRSRHTLLAVQEAESRFRPLRLLFRPDKRDNERRFVDSVRRAYLLPSLERAIRQRLRDKILSALVALYATRDNTLGALVNAQPGDWSSDLEMPRDTLQDYVRYSTTAWSEVAVVALPPLLQSEVRADLTELAPWRAFLGRVTQAIKQPYITQSELTALQQESARLQLAIVQIRRSAYLRQLYRNLAEESPLDMPQLFGRDTGVLMPNPWLSDSQDSLARVLQLVREGSLQVERAGTKSLYQLLRWLNESGGSASAVHAPEEEGTLRFILPADTAAYEISRRDWQELLLRSRRRTFSLSELRNGLGEEEGAAALRTLHERPRKQRCGLPSRRHPNRRPCLPGQRAWRSANGAPVVLGSDPPAAAPRADGRKHPAALPLWSAEEFTPKLAALLTGNELPALGLSELYNRVVYQREVLPLVQELKKALAGNRNLGPQDKIALSRLVQEELSTYSRHYCAALLNYHLGYHIGGSQAGSLHTELLDLVKPGSRFVARLQAVADNATLPGLEEPYLQPLAQCIAEFRPLVELMAGRSPAPAPAARDRAASAPTAGTTGAAGTAGAAGASPVAGAAASPAAGGAAVGAASGAAGAGAAAGGSPAGLAGYKEAVNKLIAELDSAGGSPAPAAGGDRSAALRAQLSPLGRSALGMHDGKEDSALRQAEQFLDHAGIAGPLRRPFLAPFLAVYHAGTDEMERVLADHWQSLVKGQLEPLLNRFPFNPGAEREIAPAELDFLSDKKGPLFADLRGLYAPALTETAPASFSPRSGALGTLRLPKDLLPTVNKMAKLSRALFSADGNRQPLQLAIRGLPGPQVAEGKSAQPALAYLQVGKAAVYGFNQQPSASPLAVEWWMQGAAVVGVETVAAKSGRKHTQTLEVGDSAWSLFRLLQRSTLDASGVSTWRIASDDAEEAHAIRFIINPDPWELFRVHDP